MSQRPMSPLFIKVFTSKDRQNFLFVNINYVKTIRKSRDHYIVVYNYREGNDNEGSIDQETFEELTGEYEGSPVIVGDEAYEEAI